MWKNTHIVRTGHPGKEQNVPSRIYLWLNQLYLKGIVFQILLLLQAAYAAVAILKSEKQVRSSKSRSWIIVFSFLPFPNAVQWVWLGICDHWGSGVRIGMRLSSESRKLFLAQVAKVICSRSFIMCFWGINKITLCCFLCWCFKDFESREAPWETEILYSRKGLVKQNSHFYLCQFNSPLQRDEKQEICKRVVAAPRCAVNCPRAVTGRAERGGGAGKAWGSPALNRVVGSWAAAQAAEPAWQAAIRKDTASQEWKFWLTRNSSVPCQALQRAAAAADQRVLRADSIKGSAGQMPEFSAILSSSFVKELTQSQRKDACFLVRLFGVKVKRARWQLLVPIWELQVVSWSVRIKTLA